MAILTARKVPDDMHRALRVRAARHGRSTEAEARDTSPHEASGVTVTNPWEVWTLAPRRGS